MTTTKNTRPRTGLPISLALWGTLGVLTVALLAWSPRAGAADPPPDFIDVTVADQIYAPVQIEMAPDGRLVVLTDSGQAWIIVDDVRLPTPLFDIRNKVDDVADRGLLSMAFDNDFANNGYIYVVYTFDTNGTDDGVGRTRVSRFTVNGNTAGNEVVVFDQLPDADVALHYGGAIEMGADGKLYISVGDHLLGANGQDRTNIKGTVLRINTDGTIPTDNPFYGQLTGVNRAIYAYGLRNPWQMHEDDRNGRIYVSDVGSDDWEELNVLSAGANFGWFLAEGPADPGNPAHVGFTDPLWAYPHFGIDPAATFEGCAIVGGAIYAPANATFPAEFFGKYLTADYCTGQMVAIDPATGQATPFMGGFDEIVDFAVHPTTGDVYYLDRSFRGDNQFPKGGVGKISYTGQVDQITFITQPSDVSIAAGSDATFFVSVSAPGNVTYQWTRDGVAVAGANSPQLVVPAVGPADDGARFAVRVTSGALTATSETATLTISANTAPVPSIQLTGGVADGYRAGTPIAFTGSATDAEDGAVPSASLTWEARLNHDIHDHGLVDGIVGASGSVTVPPEIETSTNVWVTIYLTATDSDGTSATTSVRVDPRVVTITLDTQPGGLSLMFEGAMVATPFTFDSVTGVTREFAAPATQVAGGVSYQFSSWSDGLGRNQPRTTPATDATFVATFDQVAAPDGCVITAGPAGGITLSWAAVGGETTYNIRNADGWVATVDGFLSYTDVDGTIDLDYLVRARPGGVTIDVPCVADDEPPPPPPVDGCTITAIPGGVRLDWQAVAGVDTFHIRNTNGWVADAVGTTTFTVVGGAVDAGYFVRHRLGPDVVDRPCTDGPPPPAQGCVATVVAGGVRLDWQPVDGIALFHVRNNGGWVADVIGATTFTSPGAAVGDSFYVRHREGAEIIDRPCAQ